MAWNAAVTLEVRLGGSDTNGGGFKTGATGTDWSLQNSAQYSVTDGVTAGTTTVTSASAAFGTDVVGNLIYIAGGTGSVVGSWYEITARASSSSITVDRSTGLTAGTGVTLKIGGALASIGTAARALSAGGGTAGVTVFMQYNASPYVITSATTNISGGCALPNTGSYWIGYDANRTKYPAPGGNRPTFQLASGVSSAVIFTGTNNSYNLQNVILDCNNQSLSRGGLMSGEYFYVKVINGIWNSTGAPLQDNSVGRAILCEVSGCTVTGGAAALKMSGHAHFCVVHDNSVASNTPALVAVVGIGCIVYGTTTGQGFSSGTFINCVSYNNAQGGFYPQNGGGTYINCIAENNGTFGFVGGTSRYALINCASYNNTSGRSSAGTGLVFDIGAITGSGSFFTNAAAADFTLNNTAGAGALCRATGFPTTFPV